jgi:hypothetical protein
MAQKEKRKKEDKSSDLNLDAIEITQLFSRNAEPSKKSNWEHGGYYVFHRITDFFRKPKHQRALKEELDLIDCVKTLVDGKYIEARDLNYSKELIKLHRILENTRARRRLEKWSLKVISCYLSCILLVVLLSYCKIPHSTQKGAVLRGILEIEPSVMIAILTTTTANIIGLGLIVLRGHFHLIEDISEKEMDVSSNDSQKKEESSLNK